MDYREYPPNGKVELIGVGGVGGSLEVIIKSGKWILACNNVIAPRNSAAGRYDM